MPEELTNAQVVKKRQIALNTFTSRYLKGVGPILADGKPGPATRKRIVHAKWWLGWDDRSDDWSDKLSRALARPRDRSITSAGTVARGIARRNAHNIDWVKSHFKSGVTTFDGVRVAAWLVPYLQHARDTGIWKGRLVSGWRDPAYSEKLCYAMCGAPSCLGKCAGRASNHSGSVKPAGAIDVSDYYNFGRAIRGWGNPHIFNALGVQDPVHFSSTGR